MTIYKIFRTICQVSSLDKKKIDETRDSFLEKIKYNDSISEKYKKTCTNLNYVEHLLVLAPTITAAVLEPRTT